MSRGSSLMVSGAVGSHVLLTNRPTEVLPLPMAPLAFRIGLLTCSSGTVAA
jgi:hypothetical protein